MLITASLIILIVNRIILAAEIDCYDPPYSNDHKRKLEDSKIETPKLEDPLKLITQNNYVELKTNITISSEKMDYNFRRYNSI